MPVAENGAVAGGLATAAAKMANEFNRTATCAFVTNGFRTADPGSSFPSTDNQHSLTSGDAEPRDGLLSIAERPSIVRRPRVLHGIKQRRCRNQQDSGHLLNRAQRKLGRTSAKDVVKMME